MVLNVFAVIKVNKDIRLMIIRVTYLLGLSGFLRRSIIAVIKTNRAISHTKVLVYAI